MADEVKTIDLTAPEVQAAIAEQVKAATAEAAAKADATARKNAELLNEYKSFKKQFEGIDPEQHKALMQRLEQDEDGKLIREGKIDDVVAARTKRQTERMKADYDSKLNGLTEERAALEKRVAAAESRVAELVIDGAVRQGMIAASPAGDSAVSDAVMHARTLFVLEDGQPIMRDAAGQIVTGKNGPITIAEWIENCRQTHPHRYAKSSGGGATGNNGGGSGAMKRSTMSNDEKTAYVAKHGASAFMQLPL